MHDKEAGIYAPTGHMKTIGLASRLREGLMADPELRSRDIKVEAIQGTVKLTGMVMSGEEKAKVMTLARGIEGVREIKDGLVIKGEAE